MEAVAVAGSMAAPTADDGRLVPMIERVETINNITIKTPRIPVFPGSWRNAVVSFLCQSNIEFCDIVILASKRSRDLADHSGAK